MGARRGRRFAWSIEGVARQSVHHQVLRPLPGHPVLARGALGSVIRHPRPQHHRRVHVRHRHQDRVRIGDLVERERPRQRQRHRRRQHRRLQVPRPPPKLIVSAGGRYVEGERFVEGAFGAFRGFPSASTGQLSEDAPLNSSSILRFFSSCFDLSAIVQIC